MKGLLIKDFLTIKKKYGVPRLIMDVAIIIALMIILEGTGAIYISFLLIPMEVASMVMSLTTCDEQWKWGKYAISLPVSKTQIVKSRYAFALILSLVGFAVALGVNTISFICFPAYRFGFYVFLSIASLGFTLLFLSFILPSNYSLGVNAGFAAMIIMVILLIILGIWSKLTNNAIMWFVVEHFELSMVITFVGVAILFVLSYALSVSFFKRKHT